MVDIGDAELIKRDMLDRLIRRINERAMRGEHPPVLSLPEHKHDFPKLLCLDLNKWIDLSRAQIGDPQGEPFRPALEAIQRAIDGGRLLVPVAGANAVEAMVPNDEGRRRRLAEFMVRLSCNHSVVNDAEMAEPELRAALMRVYIGTEPTSLIRSRLVHRGMIAAIAGRALAITNVDPTVSDFLVAILLEPEVSVLSLAGGSTRSTVLRYRRAAEETALMSTILRAQDGSRSVEERRRAGLVGLFDGKSLPSQLEEMFASFGGDPSVFHAWRTIGDNAERFASAVPGIDVLATLVASRDQNPKHATHKNDQQDLSFLRVAIPYANFLVAEKSWAHVANASGLSKKYDTTVLTDLKRLPDVLVAQGCG